MEQKQCGPLLTIANAVAVQNNSSFVVGDTVHIACQPGYSPAATPSSHLSSRDDIVTSSDDEPVSSLTVTCLDDLTWSPPQHACHSTSPSCWAIDHTCRRSQDFIWGADFSSKS